MGTATSRVMSKVELCVRCAVAVLSRMKRIHLLGSESGSLKTQRAPESSKEDEVNGLEDEEILILS